MIRGERPEVDLESAATHEDIVGKRQRRTVEFGARNRIMSGFLERVNDTGVRTQLVLTHRR
ncbi:hypothetical protein UB44_03420, partial [Burkholderiaceae bacterium 26]